MEWIYDTALTVAECFDRLLGHRPVTEDELNPARFEMTRISDSRLYFVYKGRRFGKQKRTEFIMNFYSSDLAAMQTKVVLNFSGELFHIPLPMTSVQEMDCFMEEMINAYRRK